DPDAPRGTFTHWLRYDIPADARELPAGDKETGVSGENDFQANGYGGPCPPPSHGAHRYFFRLFALGVDSLGVRQGAKRSEIEQAMQGHIVGQTELMGKYIRHTR